MTKINCNVTNCSHNKSSVCYSNIVNIKGGQAKEACHTACGNFLDMKDYSNLTNNTSFSLFSFVGRTSSSSFGFGLSSSGGIDFILNIFAASKCFWNNKSPALFEFVDDVGSFSR